MPCVINKLRTSVRTQWDWNLVDTSLTAVEQHIVDESEHCGRRLSWRPPPQTKIPCRSIHPPESGAAEPAGAAEGSVPEWPAIHWIMGQDARIWQRLAHGFRGNQMVGT